MKPSLALLALYLFLCSATVGCGTEDAPHIATPTAAPAPVPTHPPDLRPTSTSDPFLASTLPPLPTTPTPTPAPRPAPTITPMPTQTAGPVPASPTPSPPPPTVLIGDVPFQAEIADTPALRSKGLSGRESLPPTTGMLFIFEGGVTSAFWMGGMLFALDFIWISKECAVVDITPDVPAPAAGASASQLPARERAAYTFEINAGEAELYEIAIGDPVRFSGIPSVAASKCQISP